MNSPRTVTRRNSSAAGVEALPLPARRKRATAARTSAPPAWRSGFPSRPCVRAARRRARSGPQRPRQPRRRAAAGFACRSRPVAAGQPAFRGLVMELQRDQQALRRTQRQQRHREDQRNPEQRVQPVGRLVERSRPRARRATTTKPANDITKNAGPSAESAAEKSWPQRSQRGATLRNPANSAPCPQRGQRPARPRRAIARSDWSSCASCRPSCGSI